MNTKRGVVYVWVAISALVMMLFLGIAVDMGHVALALQQLQNAADAAALAGARTVRHDSESSRNDSLPLVRDAALALAHANPTYHVPVDLDRNDANAPGGDVVLGRFDRETGAFRPTTRAVRAVKVVARRTPDSLDGPLPLLFGPIVNVLNVNITRTAIAMAEGGTGSGIIALNRTEPCTLHIQGSVFLDLENGAAQVDSSDPCAFCVTGNSSDTNAPEINVVGGACTGPNDQFDEMITENSPYIADPLADLPDPPPCGPERGAVKITGAETYVLLPGTYSSGIEMTNSGAILILEPGIYCLDGVGLQIKGGNLGALGVMFYVFDSTPADNAESAVYLGGNGVLRITPPDPDVYNYPGAATYEGVSIFQARANTNESTIIGTNLMDLDGTLYFPSAHLELGGTGEGFGNQLIADTLEIFGTGNISIQYDGRDPAPGVVAFLVQ
jgi:hypothetical protein